MEHFFPLVFVSGGGGGGESAVVYLNAGLLYKDRGPSEINSDITDAKIKAKL